MDGTIIMFLKKCNIDVDGLEQLEGKLIPRDVFLSTLTYDSIKDDIKNLKTLYSSSTLTGLQSTAKKDQKWPLLNLVRQILRINDFIMKPIRRADGATKDGKKKYKRYFLIESKKKSSLLV
jgi:hypothetical protein